MLWRTQGSLLSGQIPEHGHAQDIAMTHRPENPMMLRRNAPQERNCGILPPWHEVIERMKEIRLPTWREALLNFMLMLGFNLAYEALHKLRAMGQIVSGMVIDSIGIAAIFALLMYFLEGRRSRGGHEDAGS